MSHDSRGRRIIDCAHMTVEYESVRGRDAVLLVPFPSSDDADEHSVLLTGSYDEIRAVLSSIDAMIDDWESQPEGTYRERSRS